MQREEPSLYTLASHNTKGKRVTTKYIVFAANGKGQAFNAKSPESALDIYTNNYEGTPVQVATVSIVNGLFIQCRIQDIRKRIAYEVV